MSRLFIVLLITSLFFGCSSLKITYDYDKEVDFTKFKSLTYYGWAKNSDQVLSEYDRQRIEGAFAMEFIERGIQPKQAGGDIVVSLFVIVDQKTGTTAYTNHYGGYAGGYGYYPAWGWGGGYTTTTYHDYDYLEGTLIIDVYEAETKNLIWQGVVAGKMEGNSHSSEENIERTAKEIMKNYPIQPAKR